jgi:type IV secretory pathway VirB2 component (pilin)
MTSIPDDEIDEIAKKILLKLEKARFKDLTDDQYSDTILHLSDMNYANTILQQIDNVSARSNVRLACDMEKEAVVKALLHTTWRERLYFIIRSFLMGRLGGLILIAVVWYVGVIDVYGMIMWDIFLFVITLVVTRLFNAQIVKATRMIVTRLARHKTTRDFIMKYF